MNRSLSEDYLIKKTPEKRDFNLDNFQLLLKSKYLTEKSICSFKVLLGCLIKVMADFESEFKKTPSNSNIKNYDNPFFQYVYNNSKKLINNITNKFVDIIKRFRIDEVTIISAFIYIDRLLNNQKYLLTRNSIDM